MYIFVLRFLWSKRRSYSAAHNSTRMIEPCTAAEKYFMQKKEVSQSLNGNT
jgi:hypothetical protein